MTLPVLLLLLILLILLILLVSPFLIQLPGLRVDRVDRRLIGENQDVRGGIVGESEQVCQGKKKICACERVL